MTHRNKSIFSLIVGLGSICAAQSINLPDSICAKNTPVVKVTGTLALGGTEGPAVNSAGDLYFSEPNASKIWKIPASGTIPSQPFISNSNTANGNTIDVQERLVTAQLDKVTRFNADGTVAEVLAQSAGALQLQKVNDLTMGTNGQMYFTNWSGGQVFYRDPTTGITRVVASGYSHANGVFLIEEDSTLFVNEDNPGIIYKYKVAADGSISKRTEFGRANIADGLRIDTHGNVYCAAYGDKSIVVFNAAGVKLGTIDFSAVASNVTNCAFGGTEDKVLYVTTSNAVYKVQLKISGRRLSTIATPIRSAGYSPVIAKPGIDGPVAAYTLDGKIIDRFPSVDAFRKSGRLPGIYVLHHSNTTRPETMVMFNR
jgi:gluconolactonase